LLQSVDKGVQGLLGLLSLAQMTCRVSVAQHLVAPVSMLEGELVPSEQLTEVVVEDGGQEVGVQSFHRNLSKHLQAILPFGSVLREPVFQLRHLLTKL